MPGVRETPLENLQWRLTWPAYDESQLAAALEDYLGGIGRDDFATAVRLRLWNELNAARYWNANALFALERPSRCSLEACVSERRLARLLVAEHGV